MSAGTNEDPRMKAELLEEIEELRSRLGEAEQTLDAIRSGDVDALVVNGPHGEQVFSLTGAERTYRLIVETMNEAALTVALDETILFCNQRFCDLLKTPMASTIGRKVTSFVGSAQREPLRMLLAAAQAGPVQEPLTLRDSNDNDVPTQISASLLRTDDDTSICLVATDLTELEAQATSIRVLREQRQALEASRAELESANASLRDSRRSALNVAEDAVAARLQAEETSVELRREVAERKRVEEELQRAKEMAESATRAKSQFLANMSHELRTPMTGVLGMLDLALSGNLKAEQRNFLEAADTSARSLLRILNDILDLTKIEMGKFSMEEKPFSIRKCVDDTFKILLPVAKSKGLGFNFSISDDMPEILIGDQTRLNQVLTNLVGNAVKFTNKGKVEIHVASAASAPGGKRRITVAVTDTGIGIPGDKRDLLFKSFSQVDESHSRSYGGTGLGLAISKEIVERMGGTITFTSDEGKGSTFSCTIPFGEVETQRDAVIAPSRTETPGGAFHQEGTGKPLLLIAEDDPVIGILLQTMLHRAGYEMHVAEDGQKAVEMWETGNYGLIMMDVQMPRMNGFQATAAIREKEGARGSHIPIVAMTAHALKEDKERCIDAGMDAYLSKPIDFNVCLELIAETLKKSEVVSVTG
jgi:PAS domain S-box-containing protein